MSETNGKFKEIGVLRDVEKYLEAQKMLSSSLQSATLHLMKAKRKNLRGVPDVENIRTEIDPTFVEQAASESTCDETEESKRESGDGTNPLIFIHCLPSSHEVDSTDPIFLFSALPSQELRNAQKGYKAVLDAALEATAIIRKLHLQEIGSASSSHQGVESGEIWTDVPSPKKKSNLISK